MALTKKEKNEKRRLRYQQKKEEIMSNAKPVEKEIMSDAKPVENKPIEKFLATYAVYHFSYNVIDPDTGKPVIKRDENNNPLYSVGGKKKTVQQIERFKTLSDKMSKGFLSYAEYDPNNEDPQEQERGRALRAESVKDDVSVYTEDVYQKQDNYEAFVERKALKDEKVKNSKNLKKIADLEARLKAA